MLERSGAVEGGKEKEKNNGRKTVEGQTEDEQKREREQANDREQ